MVTFPNDQNRVYFLLKDPHWTFIWWYLTPETCANSQVVHHQEHDEVKFILRTHDVTDILFDGTNSHFFFDIEVTSDTGHWYLKIEDSNRNYCVEVGFKAEDNTFHPIIRSNTLSLPPDHPSDSAEECWSTITI